MLLLIDHFPGCSPLTPCASCRAASYLRTKLSPEDIAGLISVIENVAPKTGDSRLSLNTPISELKISTRLRTALENESIVTIEDILKTNQSELLRTPNFGPVSLNELLVLLYDNGYQLPKHRS